MKKISGSIFLRKKLSLLVKSIIIAFPQTKIPASLVLLRKLFQIVCTMPTIRFEVKRFAEG